MVDWNKGKSHKRPFEMFVMIKIAAGSYGNHIINEDELLKQIMEEYGCSIEMAKSKLMEFLNTPPYNEYYTTAWRGKEPNIIFTLQNPTVVMKSELKKYFPRFY